MKVRPIQNRVSVKRDERDDDKTPGGIIIPDNAKEPLTRGTVLAVGPGKIVGGRLIEPVVKSGDHILFGKYSGQEVRVDGEDLLIMPEDEIYGVIEDD